ncbi:MAG: hypothetical protein ACK53L_26805, partial [Pirellulaceae bacterium]
GQLQGANGSLTGIAGVIGPSLFSGIYAYSVKPDGDGGFPGLAFIVAAGCLGLGLAIAVWTLQKPPAVAAEST